MTDLDRNILDLRLKGKSLRQIASALAVSHATVSRRLKEMERVSLPWAVRDDVTEEVRPEPHPGVTPRRTANASLHKGKKEGNPPRSDDLVGDLIRFLEGKGELYQMQNGGYQLRAGLVTLRIYITRRDG